MSYAAIFQLINTFLNQITTTIKVPLKSNPKFSNLNSFSSILDNYLLSISHK